MACSMPIKQAWAVRSGQYEDDYTPSVRILFEDEPQKNKSDTEAENHINSKPKK